MALIDIITHRRASSTPRQKVSLKTRLDIWRSRRALAQLDTRALDDIGISAEDAQHEARLAAWDVPTNWRR